MQIYKREKMLKIKDLYRIKACTAVYKVLNNNYMPFLHHIFMDLHRNHEHQTRNRDQLLLPIPRLKAVAVNFIYKAIQQWNNIESETRNLESVTKLKSVLVERALNSY